MKKKNLPLIENVEITGVAAEGKAVVRIDDIVTFVPYCVPGDVVDLQVTKKKHSFMEARVARMVKPSDKRCEPVCKHYGTCGGCKWQILPYAEQLRWKQQQVEDNLTHIGKLALPAISPILGSKKIYQYRNKLEFAFADHQWLTNEQMRAGVPFTPGLGFHIPNCFDKVLQIDECHLMDNYNDLIRNGIYDKAQELGLTFYNERTHIGDIRNLMLRNNHKDEWMLVVVFAGSAVSDRDEKNILSEAQQALMTYIHETFSRIVSLIYVINNKLNDTIGDLPIHVFAGQDHIIEKMEGLQFKVGPKSFYQTNTEQAYELYKVVREFAFKNNPESPIVYDLYTGTGTIANFVASRAAKVVGIEYVPEAIEDAKVNAAFNGLSNTEFYAGDMKDILTTSFVQAHGKPDIIIADPPRAGIHEDVIKVMLQAAPERIVYVSCNPATQARDLALLCEEYAIEAVQPVDMFPHTHHVENVVLLTQKKVG